MPGPKAQDLSNKKFGQLIVLKRNDKRSKNKKNYVRWDCRYSCGKEVNILGSNLVKRNHATISCGCYGSNIKWKGYNNLSFTYWQRCIRGAKKRGHEFSISIEYAWQIFEKQKGLCALTGIPIKISRSIKKQGLQTASMDRIDPKKGYIIDNIQWVHKDINRMKSNLDQNDFIEKCRRVVDYDNSKINR